MLRLAMLDAFSARDLLLRNTDVLQDLGSFDQPLAIVLAGRDVRHGSLHFCWSDHRDTAIPHGRWPTRIVPVTRFVRVSTMEMSLERPLAV